MYDEIIADVITVIIFVFYFAYIFKKLGKQPLTYVLFVFSLGIWILTIADIFAVAFYNNLAIECIGSKITALGTLIGILGLLTALTMFPRKNVIYKALPSIYVVSFLLSVYLFFTPHMLYCHPEYGAIRGTFWSMYMLWVFSLLILAVSIPLYTLILTKTKAERMQALYMTLGSAVVLGYLGLAQLAPIYFEDFEYFTAVHMLPVMGLLFTIALVKYGMFIVVPMREPKKSEECCVKVELYKINGIANRHTAFKAFREEISKVPGMIITIAPPALLRKRYVLEKTPIVWLTYFNDRTERCIIPDRLHFEAMYAAMNFVDNGGDLILIDGAEYIIENFGRRPLAEFVEDLKDMNNRLTIVLAVETVKSVQGLTDKDDERRAKIPDPRVIMLHSAESLAEKDMLVITTKEEQDMRGMFGNNIEVLKLTGDYGVDRLLFEGIKSVEDSKKREVYIECMDYILSVGKYKNVMNLLKDIIDIVVPRGGYIYIRYTPRAEESPLIAQFIESIQ